MKQTKVKLQTSHALKWSPDLGCGDHVPLFIDAQATSLHLPSPFLLTLSALPTKLNSGVLPGLFRR